MKSATRSICHEMSGSPSPLDEGRSRISSLDPRTRGKERSKASAAAKCQSLAILALVCQPLANTGCIASTYERRMVTIFDNPAIVETATMEHVEFPSLVDAVDYALLPFDLGGFNGRGAKLGDPQEVSVYSKNEITLSMDTLDGGKLVLGVNVTTGSPTTF